MYVCMYVWAFGIVCVYCIYLVHVYACMYVVSVFGKVRMILHVVSHLLCMHVCMCAYIVVYLVK